MILNITPQNQQSNYDLCQQAIGGLDGFIAFLSSNGINNSRQSISSVKFDTNNVINRLFSGYQYSTLHQSQVVGLLDNEHNYLTTVQNYSIMMRHFNKKLSILFSLMMSLIQCASFGQGRNIQQFPTIKLL